MRIDFTDADGTEYLYEENFWTGKRELAINGVQTQKHSKKVFNLPDGGHATVKGSFLTGITLQMNDGKQVILCSNEWYEWLLIFMPLLNIGVGIFCGAIGGGLSGFFAILAGYINAMIVRSKLNMVLKVVLCLVVLAVSFFIWFFLYLIIVVSIFA